MLINVVRGIFLSINEVSGKECLNDDLLYY